MRNLLIEKLKKCFSNTLKPLQFVVLISVTSLPLQHATAGSLYLPVQMSPEIEARVERLFVVANMAIIKRPIPIKQVQIAIERAQKTHPGLASAVTEYLERYAHLAGVSHLSVEGSVVSGTEYELPNQRGIGNKSDYLVSGSAYLALNDFVAINIGGIAGERGGYQKDEFVEGSYLSIGWDYLQADIGNRAHWWGPFQESDMLLSTHAPAMPGVTLSNVKPLPWFGIQYELFAAQMSESDVILSDDRSERLNGNPLLAGVHLSFSPVDGFAIGFNRLLQFGGADRDQSANGFYNAFFNVKESENINRAGTDFGNQLSSITTRYTFAGEFPVSVYMEYGGEDSSKTSGIHLGNTALMFGIHIPQLTPFLDFTWETAEWQNAWYVNGNYSDQINGQLEGGLTQYGVETGHWGASQRVAGLGAKAQTAKLIWDISAGKSLTFKYQELENVDTPALQYDTSRVYKAEYAQSLGELITGFSFSSGNDVFGDSFTKLSGFIRW